MRKFCWHIPVKENIFPDKKKSKKELVAKKSSSLEDEMASKEDVASKSKSSLTLVSSVLYFLM